MLHRCDPGTGSGDACVPPAAAPNFVSDLLLSAEHQRNCREKRKSAESRRASAAATRMRWLCGLRLWCGRIDHPVAVRVLYKFSARAGLPGGITPLKTPECRIYIAMFPTVIIFFVF